MGSSSKFFPLFSAQGFAKARLYSGDSVYALYSYKVAEIIGLNRLTAVNAWRSLYPAITLLPRPYNGSQFKRLTEGALLIHRFYYLAEQPFDLL